MCVCKCMYVNRAHRPSVLAMSAFRSLAMLRSIFYSIEVVWTRRLYTTHLILGITKYPQIRTTNTHTHTYFGFNWNFKFSSFLLRFSFVCSLICSYTICFRFVQIFWLLSRSLDQRGRGQIRNKNSSHQNSTLHAAHTADLLQTAIFIVSWLYQTYEWCNF